MKDSCILKWAMRRNCSPPLTLNHLQHHIHDVLVTGSSALRAEETIQEGALAAKTNHSCNPLVLIFIQHFCTRVTPILSIWGPISEKSGHLWELPALSNMPHPPPKKMPFL